MLQTIIEAFVQAAVRRHAAQNDFVQFQTALERLRLARFPSARAVLERYSAL